MSTVVTCPACQRKLKVAPASVGKSVKCPCGNVFVAHEAAPEPAAATMLAETIIIACDNCHTRLKVPASARGRKMKCSKCATVFVVGGEEVLTPPPLAFEAEPEAPRPRPGKAPARPPSLAGEDALAEFEEAPPPRPKGKGRPAPLALADDEGARPRAQAPAPSSGVVGCLLNLLVLAIVLAYAAAFVPFYLHVVTYDQLGLHKPRAVLLGKGANRPELPEPDGKKDEAKGNQDGDAKGKKDAEPATKDKDGGKQDAEPKGKKDGDAEKKDKDGDAKDKEDKTSTRLDGEERRGVTVGIAVRRTRPAAFDDAKVPVITRLE
jgi:predicted Zn finger-like uncharacterized protein